MSSADASRLAYVSQVHQGDVYVAGFASNTGLIDAPRRLTLDDRYDIPTAWTADSTAVVFYSNRNGTSDIFTQRLDSDVAEPVVVSPGDQDLPRVTSDGRWVLYTDSSQRHSARVEATIRRRRSYYESDPYREARP